MTVKQMISKKHLYFLLSFGIMLDLPSHLNASDKMEIDPIDIYQIEVEDTIRYGNLDEFWNVPGIDIHSEIAHFQDNISNRSVNKKRSRVDSPIQETAFKKIKRQGDNSVIQNGDMEDFESDLYLIPGLVNDVSRIVLSELVKHTDPSTFYQLMSVSKLWHKDVPLLIKRFTIMDWSNSPRDKWSSGQNAPRYAMHIDELSYAFSKLSRAKKDVILSKFENLTSLDLSKIKSISQKTITSLTGLTHLKLTKNKSVTGKTLLSLPKLTSLDLTYNKKIKTETVSALTNLKVLKISLNTGDITSEAIANLTNLEELDVSRNGSINDGHLKNLTKLRALNIVNTKITSSYVRSLPNLKSLTVDINKHFQNQDLSTLTNLTELSVRVSPFTTPEAMTNLTNLTRLNITGFCYPEIRSEHFTHIKNLTFTGKR